MFFMSDDPVETLLRWESAGGVWRVIGRAGGSLTIGLFRCDGGEQIDLLRSDDANLLEFVGARESNVD
jgi:hypothetical protein